jgi:DeoR family transcriptional regulator of aga operon
MLALVSSREFVRVAELVDRFGVSEVTVRTDLDTLSRDGLVRRVHGGVRPGARSRAERSFEETTTSHSAAKAAIGIAAAGLVEDDDSILLDVGTTTAALAKALVLNESLDDLTVFTNGLRIAAELERAVPRITVVVTGGTLRPMQYSLVEPLASLMLARIRPSIVFLGASGVHAQHGITNVNLPEAGLKSTMLATASAGGRRLEVRPRGCGAVRRIRRDRRSGHRLISALGRGPGASRRRARSHRR